MSGVPSQHDHTDLSPEDIRDLFRAKGLRCTRQREVIYAALAQTKTHPTADELYRSVGAGEARLSLATVYNTLEALAGAGLCTRIATPGAAARYDADVGEHVHVVLPDGRLVDLPHELSADILRSIPESLVDEAGRCSGARVTGVRLHLIVERDEAPTASD